MKIRILDMEILMCPRIGKPNVCMYVIMDDNSQAVLGRLTMGNGTTVQIARRKAWDSHDPSTQRKAYFDPSTGK